MMSSWKHQLGPFGIFIGALLLASAVHGPASDTAPSAPTLSWQPWSDSIFDQARREHKFVLLDLQAVWCHWCHVMDVKTYADPHVMELINSRYIAVRVDQDSRPDLASRYQDYGWPATVVFNSDGSEIVKRQGYPCCKQSSTILRLVRRS
jgi:thiol:disulfide interchange protein